MQDATLYLQEGVSQRDPTIMPHDEFTHAGYTAMLHRFMEAGYSFAGFQEASSLLEAGDPFVLMRHDIDFDLDAAVEIAELPDQVRGYEELKQRRAAAYRDELARRVDAFT